MAASEINRIGGYIIMITDKGCFAKDIKDNCPVFYNVDYNVVEKWCEQNLIDDKSLSELNIYISEKVKDD